MPKFFIIERQNIEYRKESYDDERCYDASIMVEYISRNSEPFELPQNEFRKLITAIEHINYHDSRKLDIIIFESGELTVERILARSAEIIIQKEQEKIKREEIKIQKEKTYREREIQRKKTLLKTLQSDPDLLK